MKGRQIHEIAQRYCSSVDANVVLARINKDATEPPRYECLSSHLCGGASACEDSTCRHRLEKDAHKNEPVN